MKSSEIKSLKRGDTVRISFETKVTGNGGIFSVYTENAGHFIDKQAAAERNFTGDEGFPFGQVDITLVKRADPDNWPPKPGDIWRGKSGREYHSLGNGINILWDENNNTVSRAEVLRDSPFLIHRKVIK